MELHDISQTYRSKMVSTLKSSVTTRLTQYEDAEIFQLATKLDPRFKLDWCSASEKRDMTVLLGERVDDIAPDSPSSVRRADSSEPPTTKRCKLFSFMTQTKRAPVNNTNEVDKYLSEPTIPDDSDPLS